MFYRFVLLILLAVCTQSTLADDRLRIELLPVYILPDDSDAAASALEEGIASTYEAFVATRRVIVKSGVSAPESSGDLVNFFHLDSISEFNSCHHLCQVVKAA